MHNQLKIYFFICMIFISPLVNSAETSQQDRIKIITSILPLADFAHAVCGRYGKVEMLLPPGADVHTWTPRPSDIMKLTNADLFIYIGADLEPWVYDILKSIKNPDLRIIEASRDMLLAAKTEDHLHADEKHESSHASIYDPHIWLDFEHDLTIIELIEDNLTQILPENGSEFKANAEEYKEKLRELDLKYRNSLDKCPKRVLFMGGHAAFGYLAQRYQLRQISLYGLSPDARPSPKKLLEVVKTAKEHAIEVVFFEANVSPALAEVLAAEVGARTSVLNPGANLTKKEREQGITFIEIMESNLERIKNGLSCK